MAPKSDIQYTVISLHNFDAEIHIIFRTVCKGTESRLRYRQTRCYTKQKTIYSQ